MLAFIIANNDRAFSNPSPQLPALSGWWVWQMLQVGPLNEEARFSAPSSTQGSGSQFGLAH